MRRVPDDFLICNFTPRRFQDGGFALRGRTLAASGRVYESDPLLTVRQGERNRLLHGGPQQKRRTVSHLRKRGLGYNQHGDRGLRQRSCKMAYNCHFFAEIFCGIKISIYLCPRKTPRRGGRRQIAEIAQLVERNLAKVEVAGPSPVFRSEVLRRRTFFVGRDCAIRSERFCISMICRIVLFFYHSKRQQAQAPSPCADSWYTGAKGRNVPHFFSSALNYIGLRRTFRAFQSYDCQTQNVFGRWKENDSA